MSSEPTKPTAGGDEDSWETLAEDLFGIDFTKASIPDEPPPSTDFAGGQSEEETSEEATGWEQAESTDDESVPIAESEQAEVADAEATLDTREVDQAASETQERKVDTFWDALSDSDLQETSRKGSRPAEKREEGTRSQRGTPRSRSSASRAPAPQRAPAASTKDAERPAQSGKDQYVDNEEFGFGLDGEDEVSPSAEPQSTSQDDETLEANLETRAETEQAETTSSGEKSEQEGEARPRRRRRRRRRSRGTGSSKEAAETDASDKEVGIEQETETAGESEESERENEEQPEPTTGKRPSRRRSSRRRRKSPAPESAEQQPEGDEFGVVEETPQVAVQDSGDDNSGDDNSDDDDDDDERTSTSGTAHKDLPTWEEAIGYILNPSYAEARSGDSSEDTQTKKTRAKSETSKSSGRRPRRRR